MVCDVLGEASVQILTSYNILSAMHYDLLLTEVIDKIVVQTLGFQHNPALFHKVRALKLSAGRLALLIAL